MQKWVKKVKDCVKKVNEIFILIHYTHLLGESLKPEPFIEHDVDAFLDILIAVGIHRRSKKNLTDIHIHFILEN